VITSFASLLSIFDEWAWTFLAIYTPIHYWIWMTAILGEDSNLAKKSADDPWGPYKYYNLYTLRGIFTLYKQFLIRGVLMDLNIFLYIYRYLTGDWEFMNM
jgi:hypothetical protein